MIIEEAMFLYFSSESHAVAVVVITNVVSQKDTDIIDCNLKKDEQIIIVFWCEYS